MELARLVDAAQGFLQKSGADQWEILAARSERLAIGVKAEKVDKFQQSSGLGLALRVVKNGRLGFSYAMGGEEKALSKAAQEALASALSSDLTQEAGLAGPAGHLAGLEVFDPGLSQESIEDKKARALRLARAALTADPRVVHVHPAEVEEAISHFHLRTSEGLDITHQATMVSAGAMVVAADGKGKEMGWEEDSARYLADLDVERLGAQAGRRAAEQLGAGPVSDGRYDLILENRVAAEFFGVLGASFMGDNLVKGRSLLAGREGQLCFSPLLTMVDDGLYPRGLGTAPVDGEGTPQGRSVLVEQGVLRGFLWDRLWGSRRQGPSTGNAVRPSLKSPPQVGFTNLHVVPGGVSYDQMVSGLGRGLIISEVMGLHTADPVSGEFSFGAAGHLVESGRVIRPVKSIAIAGQVQEIFKAVKAVGNDLRFGGRVGAPSLLVAGQSVSGP
jgi:PmbA protein